MTLPNGNINLNKSEGYVFQVQWNNTACGFNLIKTDTPLHEVIGNIYENPELIK
jgi:hypothetical protein